uniref:Uncharacterized protein n=1 Tax=Arundo donax TaxID=35708 RepID=A0A0A9CFQ0_ARUDO
MQQTQRKSSVRWTIHTTTNPWQNLQRENPILTSVTHGPEGQKSNGKILTKGNVREF